MESLNIGSTPPGESCQQTGSPTYNEKLARKECLHYIEAIRRLLGKERGSAKLVIKSNPHDFGTYLDVVCTYDEEVGFDYAIDCESSGPMTWAEVGMKKPTLESENECQESKS